VTIVSELAGGTLTALSTVYVALENSSKILATNVANNTVQVVSHKYVLKAQFLRVYSGQVLC
jgi:hypothetical protein